MNKMHPLIKILQNLLDKRRTGNVSFKGILQIGKHDLPIDNQINIFKGGISSVDIKETIKIPKENEGGD